MWAAEWDRPRLRRFSSRCPQSPSSTDRAPGDRMLSSGCEYVLSRPSIYLLNHFRHCAGAHRAAAFANRKAQPFIHGHRRDQFHLQVHRVARHHHLRALRQFRHPSHVRRTEVELRPVSLEERRVPPSLFLAQHVYPPHERRVRRNRTRLRDHLPALHFVLFHTPQQQAYVVPSHPFIQQLLEHFHARHYRLARRTETHDLHLFPNLALATLDAPRHHRPSALNRKYLLDRHQKWLVQHARRNRDVAVHRVHQLQHTLLPLRLPVQCPQRRYPNHRNLVARKLVEFQQVPHFQLYQVQQLRIVHHVHFVHAHHDVRHPYLPRQQNVLPRLRHGPVGGCHHHDGAIHLRRQGCLAVIDVPDRPDIHVRLAAVEFFLCHADTFSVRNSLQGELRSG